MHKTQSSTALDSSEEGAVGSGARTPAVCVAISFFEVCVLVGTTSFPQQRQELNHVFVAMPGLLFCCIF